MSKMELLIDGALLAMKKGGNLEESGDLKSAITEYLKSAELLFLAAEISSGHLKETRILNAEKLLKKAEELKDSFTEKKRDSSGKDGIETLEDMGLSVTHNTNVSFDDVAGLDKVKEAIRLKVIYPLQHREKAQEYGLGVGGGILLYGPPGTGKTHIAKAVATEVNASFILVKSAALKDQWFGNFEKRINNMFEAASKCAPAILFIDEIDDLAPKRSSSSSSVMKRAVAELLVDMDGMGKRSEMLIMGATNVPWDLDEAILRPGRFDELVYVGPPDHEARKKIFEINLEGINTDYIDLDLLAEVSEGYSGADIAYIIRKGREILFKESVEMGIDRDLNTEDIISVIQEKPKTITKNHINRYTRFCEQLKGI